MVTRSRFCWVDETYDVDVDHMVGLNRESFKFQNEMFKGGFTENDLDRMWLDRKLKVKKKTERKD